MDQKQFLIETLSKKLGGLPTKNAILKEYDRILNIKWFEPMAKPPKETEKIVKLALKIFGVKAKIKYKKLETIKDWDAARGAVWDAARGAAWDVAWDIAWNAEWDAARGAAWYAVRGAVWDAARGAVWDAARGAARGAAWDVATECVMDLELFTKKYPQNPFKVLTDLWAMGFYVVGVVKGKFVLYYVPK